MSRTLRRPMFRGGRVSSYGTGIASGLAEGGRVGYYIDQRGGIVTGGDIRKSALEKLKNYYSPGSPETFPGETAAYQSVDEQPTGGGEGTNWFNWLYERGDKTPSNLYQEVYESKASKERDFEEVNKDILSFPRDVEEMGVAIEETDTPELQKKTEEQLEIERLQGLVDAKTETSIGDSEANIQEMSDRYFKLLGGDKARGQDISDMLLRFAGSKGDTTMEKFQDFAATEATVPSRTEKIKQTAGMLGIKGEQAKEASMYAMQKGLALKLAGLTDVKKDRAKTTRLADYTKQFLEDLQNPFKQRNAGTFAAATVLSEDIADGTGEFISVLGYDADGNASATAGVIYIDPVGMTKGTPFFLDNNHYSKLEDAKKAKGI